MASILGIIPSRFGSTRFPAKALADINGKTMVERVYEQAKKSSLLTDVIVATDHPKIYDQIKKTGGEVMMTSESHQSGTDRCAEVAAKTNKKYDFVINIQGDEPFIQPEQIDLLASLLLSDVELATLVIPTSDPELIFNPNTVKVVKNTREEAMYFSRNPIPFIRNFPQNQWTDQCVFLRHVGIYAYRTDVLEKIAGLKPSSLELFESLEQLRWIENGYRIKVKETPYESYGIDTPEDLERILLLMESNNT